MSPAEPGPGATPDAGAAAGGGAGSPSLPDDLAVHLVRHGRPLVDPSRPPSTWSLDPEHLDGVRTLRASGALPLGARWVSSAEPKARETAAVLTDSPVAVDGALGEQARPAGWLDDYAVRIHRSLVAQESPAAPGWETAASTRARVVDAVHRQAESAAQEGATDLVLVGHGTAWTLLVSALTGRPVDLYAWERLQLPDTCSLAGGELVRRWGSWRS
ncbi:histidine phosphatase family protein [uncultured Pseudokineococcus sp.]|uniref:histidine phosphatase family protein n=1 Tax=uncultured Pseudokineococcus sp. TaxID=1642928 RepID=UPI0026143E0D|nr:histidine phosphatase family protein [uncultured Pseudokineococcus sp.]